MAFTASRPAVVPQSGNISFFNKFPKGKTTFRILSDNAFYYFEYWNTDGKTTRLREYPLSTPSDIQRDDETGEPKPISLVMSFVAYHYDDKAVKVFQINKKSIREKIEGWADNPRIGDIRNYDIEVIRSGEGLKTKYEIDKFEPAEELSDVEIDGWNEINLERLAFGASAPTEESPPPITQEPSTTSNSPTSKFLATVQNKLAVIANKPADERPELIGKLESWMAGQLDSGKATAEEYKQATDLFPTIQVGIDDEYDIDDIPF